MSNTVLKGFTQEELEVLYHCINYHYGQSLVDACSRAEEALEITPDQFYRTRMHIITKLINAEVEE